MNRIAWCIAAGALAGLVGSSAPAQVRIPNQQHQSLTLELHSVRDHVVFYAGDIQFFLEMYVRPPGILPRIDFSNPAQAAVLRIRDRTLFQDATVYEEEYIDGELYVEEDEDQPAVEAQYWDVRVSPASPGLYVMQVDEGKGEFDFTDLAVQELYVTADSSEVEITFDRPNLVELERLQITAEGSHVELRGLLDARPRSVTLGTVRTTCRLELTGKPFEGEAEVFVEGAPQRLDVRISKKIGLQVHGPAGTVARFDRKDMRRQGLTLISSNWSQRTCKVHLYFDHPVPELKVEWD